MQRNLRSQNCRAKRLLLISSYSGFAVLIALPGVFFVTKAVSIHLFRQRQFDDGVVIFNVPGMQGMPIDTYIRWMLVFSVSFFAFSVFVLYRLIVRLNRSNELAVTE